MDGRVVKRRLAPIIGEGSAKVVPIPVPEKPQVEPPVPAGFFRYWDGSEEVIVAVLRTTTAD